MKRIFLLVIASLMMVASSAFGGTMSDVVKKVKAFNNINIVGNINVVYEQGGDYEVRLPQEIQSSIEVEVKKSSLNLYPKSSVKSRVGGINYVSTDLPDGVTIYVKAPSVKSFNIAGSGSVSVDNMTAKNVTFNVAGSGNSTIKNLSADDISFSVAGSGDIDASGVKGGKVSLNVAGSGEIKAKIGQASNLGCSVAGSGEITVSGKTDKYSKSIYGSGSINDGSLKYSSMSQSSVDYGNDGNVEYNGLNINIRNNSNTPRSVNGILSNP